MMKINPTKETFLERRRRGLIMPVFAELPASQVTPLSALNRFRRFGHPVLLESCRVNETTGRYSFVTGDPYLICKSSGETIEVSLPKTPDGKFGRRASMRRKSLTKLRELLSNYRTERIAGLPPFTGGAVGFFSYEFARRIEKLPQQVVNDLHIPEAYFIFVDAVVAFDHMHNKAWLIVNPGAREQEMGFRKPEEGQWGRLYDEACMRLEAIGRELLSFEQQSAPTGPRRDRASLEPYMSRERFESMAHRCKEYIAAGDIAALLGARGRAGFVPAV